VVELVNRDANPPKAISRAEQASFTPNVDQWGRIADEIDELVDGLPDDHEVLGSAYDFAALLLDAQLSTGDFDNAAIHFNEILRISDSIDVKADDGPAVFAKAVEYFTDGMLIERWHRLFMADGGFKASASRFKARSAKLKQLLAEADSLGID
jgi:hypothetical protein